MALLTDFGFDGVPYSPLSVLCY